MISGRDDLLMTLLHCGTLDLDMLDEVKYDFDEVIEQLDGFPIQTVGFNGLMQAVVGVGIIHIKDAIEEKIAELHGYRDEGTATTEDLKEMEALERLNPDEEIQGYYNCLDTHVWVEKNSWAYQKYLADAIKDFEENTGLAVAFL